MKVAIIGSGFSGLSAASYSAKSGNEVHIFEKNSLPGGRARMFTTDNGYSYDMGPSWYWMPDIIDSYFSDFGFKTADFFQLKTLDPQFEIVFSNSKLVIPRSFEELKVLFEKIEVGSGRQLEAFMQSAKYKYELGMLKFVNKPCYRWTEFFSPKILGSVLKLDLFSNFRSYISKYFSNPKLIALMEFPTIFLGASPKEIPALYSLMNYGGYVLGTRYPIGGYYQLVLSMKKIAEMNGAKFHFNSTVQKINIQNTKASSLVINGQIEYFDAIIASSDYHHTESLLPEKFRNYDEKYWQSRTFAPSCLIFYLGFREKVPNLQHHTLFFEYDLDKHISSIYEEKKWPEDPLFYACCPSKTDSSLAPEGHENIFLLMPIAAGLEETENIREKYLKEMISRLEKHTQTTDLLSKIDFKKSYCSRDFGSDYNAYQGNAYGLANTLSQTAVFKPKIKNKKLSNLFYTGQLTVPGPGVPPSIISGKIVAKQIDKNKIVHYEKTV